ncbi:hypothetical protein CLOP_g9652, partial [Closterium sp. NIES-67]
LLLRHFRSPAWTVVIHAVPIAPDAAPSPLRPFLVVATNTTTTSSPSASSPSPPSCPVPLVATTFPRVGSNGIHPEQLADLFTLVDQENLIRSAPPFPTPLPAAAAAATSVDAARSQSPPSAHPASPPTLASLAAYSGGRRVLCHLSPHVPGGPAATAVARGGDGGESAGCEIALMPPVPADSASPSGSHAAAAGGGGVVSAFTATVLDATPAMLDGASLPCAVFLVPQGMNRDWLYAAEEGQWQLVESANAQRLILVQQNEQPGQKPLPMAQVQEELSPLVLQLAPDFCKKTRYAIPYMTTETAAVTGTLVAEVVSPLTGAILVLDDVSSPPQCTRKLVFRRNPNLVQSDAALLPAPPTRPAAAHDEESGSTGTGASGGVAKTGGKKGGAGGAEKQGKGAAAAAGLTTAGVSKKGRRAAAKAARKQQAAEEGGVVQWVVDHGQLASQYHGAMVAGLSLVAPHMEARERSSAQLTAAVIGLGGGALPMFLRQHFPFTRITVAELDAVMAQVARDHFGFVHDSVLQLHIGDGVALIHSIAAAQCCTQGGDDGGAEDGRVAAVEHAAAVLSLTREAEPGTRGQEGVLVAEEGGKLDVIFVDADSDDPSTGMSCPAQVFLEPHFLQSARAALSENGMLVLNVVARASTKYKEAVVAVRKVFPAVYDLDVDGDINRVLFALPAVPPALAVCPDEASAGKALKLGAVRVAALAGRFAPWGKGPSLVKLADSLRVAT